MATRVVVPPTLESTLTRALEEARALGVEAREHAPDPDELLASARHLADEARHLAEEARHTVGTAAAGAREHAPELRSTGERVARAALAAALAAPSVGSSHSIGSLWSWRSAWSVMSALSVASVGSVASIGSSGSILSIGSSGSILSIGSSGSVACVGAAGAAGATTSATGTDDGTRGMVSAAAGVLALTALVAAPFSTGRSRAPRRSPRRSR